MTDTDLLPTFDLDDVLEQCYWAVRQYRSCQSDDYVVDKVVKFIDSNNLFAAKYDTTSSTRANERGDESTTTFVPMFDVVIPKDPIEDCYVEDRVRRLSGIKETASDFDIQFVEKEIARRGCPLNFTRVLNSAKKHTPQPSPQSEMVAVPIKVIGELLGSIEYLCGWQSKDGSAVVGEVAHDMKELLQPYTKGDDNGE